MTNEPLFLLLINLGVRCKRVVIFTPRPHYTRKQSSATIRRLRELLKLSGHGEEEKKPLPLPGIDHRTFISQSVTLLAQTVLIATRTYFQQ